MQTLDQILVLVEQYGYLLVFLGVMLESAGVPVPGQTILIASGILAHQGYLRLEDALLFGVLGAVIGDQIGFWVGREAGRPFVLRWGNYAWITPERLARAEQFYKRHGGKAVFISRFVIGLRTWGGPIAGVSRMRWSTFLFYNVLGGGVWVTAAVLVGYLLGESVEFLERWMGRTSLLLLVLLVVGLSFYFVHRWNSLARSLLDEPPDEEQRGQQNDETSE